jgi:hypothetical protein
MQLNEHIATTLDKQHQDVTAGSGILTTFAGPLEQERMSFARKAIFAAQSTWNDDGQRAKRQESVREFLER